MTTASRFILSLGAESFRTNEAMEAARECARYVESAEAPGHTDLMVTPESLDAYLEANPPPGAPTEDVVEAAEETAKRVRAQNWKNGGVLAMDNDEAAHAIAALVTAHAAREREACCAAVCYGCRLGWERGYHPEDEHQRLLMHKAEGCNEFGHPCHAAAIRARP